MTIKDFIDKYYLHDSILENITIDKEKQQITMNINLCYWAQDWAESVDKENGIIKIVFHNIVKYKINKNNYSNEILSAKPINSNTIELCVNQNENDIDIITIECSYVTVSELD